MMKGNNFVSMMIGLAQQRPEVKVVTDEILTPTPTTEIAEKTLELIRHPLCGIFHLTSEGECSWYEFTQAIFETLKIKTPLLPTTTKEFPSTVKRPLYSVLENSRFNALPDVQKMRHWKDALVAFLRVQYLHQ
jgi:dTDP-4-dehydrorhamnose reductase